MVQLRYLGDFGIDPGTTALTKSPTPGVSGANLKAETVPKITVKILRQIVPKLTKNIIEIVDGINIGAVDAEIKNVAGLAAFIAQTAHESAEYSRMDEMGGNTVFNSKSQTKYSYRDWKNKKVNDPDAEVYDYFFFMYDPESPSERRKKVAKDLGNTLPGDGVKFRGRGYIQLTGRSNYRGAGKALNLKLEESPDLALQPKIAMQIAAWFWKTHKLNSFTAIDSEANFKAMTKKINGGTEGLADRQRLFVKAKMALAN